MLTKEEKKKYENKEKLEAMGQESEIKGIKAVSEDIKEREKEGQKFETDSMARLDILRKKKDEYNAFLMLLTYRFLKNEDISPKHTIDVVSTPLGVVGSIRGTGFRGAFKSVGMPKFDLFACKRLAIMIGNTTAHLDGSRERTKGGLFLPDSLDEKKYGRRK